MTENGGSEIAVGADVDVRALMAEVHAEVERKKQAGLYPPEVLEELDVIGAGTADDTLTRALLGLRHGVSFDTSVATASRIPVVAPVAASFKRAVSSSIRWYVSAVLHQVEQFGANVIHALNLVADRLRSVEERAERHSVEQDAVNEAIRALKTQIGETRSAVQAAIDAGRLEAGSADPEAGRRREELESVRVRDRISLIERAVRDLGARLETTGGVEGGRTTAPSAERSWSADRAVDYLDFENHFLGGEEERRERQRDYVELFRDVPGPVVDLGCGRGEFLEVLSEVGVRCYGVDRHPDMIGHCREKGLEVVEADVLEHLASVPSRTLGGVFSAQTIEHLDVGDVPKVFELAAGALSPGGRMVIETLNPQSLYVFAWAFYMDLGHLRPLHPRTLYYLAEKAGFRDIRTQYYFLPPADLRPSELPTMGERALDGLVESVNENFRRIDALLFGPQDYAIVATR